MDEEDRPHYWYNRLVDPPAPGPVRDDVKAVGGCHIEGGMTYLTIFLGLALRVAARSIYIRFL